MLPDRADSYPWPGAVVSDLEIQTQQMPKAVCVEVWCEDLCQAPPTSAGTEMEYG